MEYDILVKNEKILTKTPELESFLQQEKEEQIDFNLKLIQDGKFIDDEDDQVWEDEKVDFNPLRPTKKEEEIISKDSPNKIIKTDEPTETKILKTYSGSKNSFHRKNSRESLENSPREFFTEIQEEEEISYKTVESFHKPSKKEKKIISDIEIKEDDVKEKSKINSMKKILNGLKKLEKQESNGQNELKETPLKKRHSSANSGNSGNSSFSDIGSCEGSPRGFQEVEEVILNAEDIEENESKLDELICKSPLVHSHKSRTKTQGWLDKAKNNTTNDNEVWEKKYVIYDSVECIITISNSKSDIPFKEYHLNKDTTLVLYGTDHKKPPRYFIKISLNAGTEYVVFSTKNMDIYWSWMKRFHQSQIQRIELELHQISKKIDYIDITIHEYKLWKEKQVKEWIKLTLFFYDEKTVLIVCDVLEMNGISGVHLNENFNLKALFGFNTNLLDKDTINEFQKEILINISCLKLDKSKSLII